MGQKVSETTTIDAPADAIRAVVYDLDAYPEWADGVTRAEVLETDDEGRPHRARFKIDAKVLQVDYVIEYTHSDERIAWTLVEGDALSQLDGSYTLVQDDGRTHVTYALEVDLSVPLPGFLKKRAAKQIVDTGLKGLGARAEART